MVFSLNQILNLVAEFANCNLSQRLVELTLFFSMMLKSMSLTVLNCTSNLGEDFSLRSLEFYCCIQFEIRKNWSVDFAKL